MRMVRKLQHRLRPRVLIRRLRRRRTRRVVGVWCCLLLVLGIVMVRLTYDHRTPHIDPSAYDALLTTVAQGESNGNYNAYFGHADNTAVRFTAMSVAQVMQWQRGYVQQGSVSSAVGRYQIIRPTLARLVQQLHIDPSTPFDQSLQDRFAIALMERRGSVDYVEKKLTQAEFAANLAKEWASLPRITGPDPQASYYAGDGVNKSRVSIGSVYGAIDKLQGT